MPAIVISSGGGGSVTDASNLNYTPVSSSHFNTGSGATIVGSDAYDILGKKVYKLVDNTLTDELCFDSVVSASNDNIDTRLFLSSDNDILYVRPSGSTTLYRLNAEVDNRTKSIPGATPDQNIHPHVSSPDGSVLELIKDSNSNWRAYYVKGDGSGKIEIALGVSAIVDGTESAFDIEYTDVDNNIGLGTTEKYSVITGDSDSKGANGLPIIQGSNPADAGASPYPLVIDGGWGDVATAPLGKRQFKRPIVLRNYTGEIYRFIQAAQAGELCLNTLDPSIESASLPPEKYYGAVRTASRNINISGSVAILSNVTGSAGKMTFNLSGSYDISSYVTSSDFIMASTSGHSSEQGLHYVKSVTSNSITTYTNMHTGSAGNTGSLYLGARIERLDGTAI